MDVSAVLWSYCLGHGALETTRFFFFLAFSSVCEAFLDGPFSFVRGFSCELLGYKI